MIGASSGLGATLLEALVHDQPQAKILAVSQSQPQVSQLLENVSWFKTDFSVGPEQEKLLLQLEEFAPQLLICALSKDSSTDVSWNLIVSTLFPARLWRWASAQQAVEQAVVVGPDGSGKIGLSALLQTLAFDNPKADLRLYSPPATSAKVRQAAAWSSEEIAKDLIVWLKHGPRFDHRRLAVTPSAR